MKFAFVSRLARACSMSLPLLLLSAAGLAALMVAGIIARLRIQDPVVAMLPAFAFFCLNLLLVIYAP